MVSQNWGRLGSFKDKINFNKKDTEIESNPKFKNPKSQENI